MKEFDEKFCIKNPITEYNPPRYFLKHSVSTQKVKSFLIQSFTHLLEAYGEGIIGEDERERKYITDLAIKDDFEGVKGLIKNQLRASQRAKLNEKVEEIKNIK